MRAGRLLPGLFLVGVVVACSGDSGDAGGGTLVRVAVFNVRELSTDKLLQVDEAGVGQNPQLQAAAQIVQRVRPDVLLLQELDHDYGALEQGLDLNARRFHEAYLEQGQRPIQYPFVFAAPCNTGILAGLDLDGDGIVAGPEHLGTRVFGGDCWGWGTYEGQYSMALLSRLPILAAQTRTFRQFRWRDLPGHHLPQEFYSQEAAEHLRLSSKSHWDVPVEVGEKRLHLLISHPTPPGFDGDEDRNGRRNFDEIKFWLHYLADDPALYDDQGRRGGYDSADPFVLLGDLNADPGEKHSIYDGVPAIRQLLHHPRLQDPIPASRGAVAGRQPGPPDYPERATAVFRGGLRVDYVLPVGDLEVVEAGVFWPAAAEDPEGHTLAEAASDHRLVWVDLRIAPD